MLEYSTCELSHIERMKEGRLTYKPSELLLLSPIGFRMEPYLDVVSLLPLSRYASICVGPYRAPPVQHGIKAGPMHQLIAWQRSCSESVNAGPNQLTKDCR